MLLGYFQVLTGGVAHGHFGAFECLQLAGETWVEGFVVVFFIDDGWYDLAGVCVVSGDYNEGFTVFLREVKGALDSFVEVNGFTDLATRVRGVILLIDGSALHLEEEAFFLVLQQVDGLGGHIGE